MRWTSPKEINIKARRELEGGGGARWSVIDTVRMTGSANAMDVACRTINAGGGSGGGHKIIAPGRWQTDFESTRSARDILQFSENKLFQSANRSRHPSLFRQNHGNRSRHPSKILLGSDGRLRQKFVFRSIHSEIGSKKVRPLSHLRNKVLKN